jgi:transaldolase
MTLMMTYNQLILAAKAGATFVSLFFNRSKEAGEDPVKIIKDYVATAKESGLKARLIVGSIRTPDDVARALAAGAHIMTIPTKILRQMPFNKRTEETREEFDKAWQEFLAMRKQSGQEEPQKPKGSQHSRKR